MVLILISFITITVHIKTSFSAETIQVLLKTRVQVLMDKFDVKCSADELAQGTKVYHDAVLLNMNEENESIDQQLPAEQSKYILN